MARWIFNHRWVANVMLVLAIISYFVIQSHIKNEMMSVLVGGVYVFTICAIGIQLCDTNLPTSTTPSFAASLADETSIL